MDEPAPHYIYVIATDTHANGPCKLGISADPFRRLMELQTGSPEVLKVHHQEPVDATKSRHLEYLLHRDLAHRRKHLEWFDMSVEHAIAHVTFTMIQYDGVPNLEERIRKRWI